MREEMGTETFFSNHFKIHFNILRKMFKKSITPVNCHQFLMSIFQVHRGISPLN